MWAIVSYDPIARLSRILHPTLVLMGDHDYHMPTCYTLLDGLRNSRLSVIEGAGHLTPYDAPDEVAERIDRFLAESRATVSSPSR
jgi:pimeloyl-ACP methyl ester carboxylesterase